MTVSSRPAMPIQIVTDSTADLPPELARAHGVEVVPLGVHFGNETYRDGVDITPEQFVKRLTAAAELPRTSQPSPAAFAGVYRSALDQGNTVISIHLSGKLSGTLSSALIARRELGDPPAITIVDSRWASMALGLVVLSAARAAPSGDAAGVLAATNDAINRARLLVFCDTLEYLQRGGRIGRAAALLGGLLSVKPLISMRDGIVVPEERVRTRARALGRLAEWALAAGPLSEYCVLHTASESDAQALSQQIAARYPGATGYVAPAGPVITTHVGPGAVGVALLTA